MINFRRKKEKVTKVDFIYFICVVCNIKLCHKELYFVLLEILNKICKMHIYLCIS